MTRSGSKLFTAIISFLLGFLFAILVEVGAVFGVYWYVTNTDLNTLMNTFNIQNVDKNGNYIYINTDKENGGASNLKELFAGLQNLIYKDGEVLVLGKSFDDIAALIPATDMLLGMVYNAIDGYMEIDREEFESTPLSGLAQVLSESLMNVKTAALLQKLNITQVTGEDANLIVKSLLMGSETEYSSVYYGGVATRDGEENADLRFPVLYDIYVYDSELGYSREIPVNGKSAYPENLGNNYDWLTPISKDEDDGEFSYSKYMLYYVPCRVTENGIEEAEYIEGKFEFSEGSGSNAKTVTLSVLEYGDDTDFIVVKPDGEGNYVIDYDAVYAALNENNTDYSDRFEGYSYYGDYARNYYYTVKNANTEKYEIKTVCGKNYFRNNAKQLVQLDALTLGDLVNDSFAPLDSVPAYTVLGENGDMAYKVFGKTTLGELMRGEVDFNKLVDDLEVGTFINNVTVDNKVMAYIAYRITDLQPASDGSYSAIYNKGEEDERVVSVRVDGDTIIEVIDANGSIIEGVKIKEIAELTKNLDMTIFLDIDANDGIMTYFGYGARGVKFGTGYDELNNGYTHTGKITVGGADKDCYIATEERDGSMIITSVWYVENGRRVNVGGTKVNGVSERMGNFTKDLTIGDVIDLEDTDNLILKAIKDSPIDGLEQTISDMGIEDIFTEDEINGSALLRGLRGTKVSELAEAIDALLIQSIYAEEIYMLPDGTDPMEVIDFNPDYEYFVLKVEEGARVGSFVSVGRLTQEEFEARGNTVYYTYGSDSGEGAKMKIVGFNSDWLYYEMNGSGGFDLTDKNSKDLEEGMAKDDASGTLTQKDYDDKGETRYYTYGAARGMWRFVLYKWYDVNTESERNAEKAYTINNFNNMVNQCATNVYRAKLGELQDAGLIDANIKGKTFNYVIYNNGVPERHSVELEDLTLKQLIEIVLLMSTDSNNGN